MTKSQIRTLLVLAGIATLVYLSGKVELPDKTKASSTPAKMVKVAEQQKGVYVPLSVDETSELFQHMLMLAWKTYPCTEIRTETNRMIQEGESKGIDVKIYPTTLSQIGEGSFIVASAKWENGVPTLAFYVDGVNYVRRRLQGHPEAFEDEFIATFLHEMHHLYDQDLANMAENPSLEQKRLAESDAWHYTVESVYLPMIRCDRLKVPDDQVLGTTVGALVAYKESDGDESHPAWQAFTRQLTAP